jgi:predicted transposase YbfD/YdcC
MNYVVQQHHKMILNNKNKRMLFGQFIGSYVREIFTQFEKHETQNVIDIVNFVDHLRLHEVIDGFSLTKKITDRATNEHYVNLTSTLKLPYECIRKHFHIETIHERMLPPVEVITMQHNILWLRENNYTLELYHKKRHYLYSYFSSIIPCICVAEIQKLYPIKLTMEKQELVVSCKIVRTRYRIPPNFNVVLYNDELGVQRGLSFNVEYDAEHNLYIGTFMLKLTLTNDDIVYVVPSIYFISNGERRDPLFYNELPASYEILDEFDLSQLSTLTRFVAEIENNIRSCWTIDPEKFYTQVPVTKVIGSDFTNSAIFCIDIPNDTSEFNELSNMTRIQCHSLIQLTKEKHLNHICVRNRATTHVVSIVYTPCQTVCITYITTLFKFGVRYKIAHLAIITKNRKEFNEYIKKHWDSQNNWIDEEYFSQLAIRFYRNISSSTTVFTPLPVQRVFMNEPFSCDLITRGLWRLHNCNCFHCKDARSQTCMCV